AKERPAGLREGSAACRVSGFVFPASQTLLPECAFSAASHPPLDPAAGTAFDPCETRLAQSFAPPGKARTLLPAAGRCPRPYGVVAENSPEQGPGQAQPARPAGTQGTGKGLDRSPERAW